MFCNGRGDAFDGKAIPVNVIGTTPFHKSEKWFPVQFAQISLLR